MEKRKKIPTNSAIIETKDKSEIYKNSFPKEG